MALLGVALIILVIGTAVILLAKMNNAAMNQRRRRRDAAAAATVAAAGNHQFPGNHGNYRRFEIIFIQWNNMILNEAIQKFSQTL